MQSSELPLVVVRGAGDLGSGVIYRLYQAGYPVVATELEGPLLVRRAVSFGSAVYTGATAVEGITARRIDSTSAIWLALRTDEIPVIVGDGWRSLQPQVIVDARIAKRNIDTDLDDAPLVIALGPGFVAGEDCHAVIETNRGHWLGRVIWRGMAEPDTRVPGNVMGVGARRVLRAPCDGYVQPQAAIGDHLAEGAIVATVADQPIVAPFEGVLRGLIHETVPVTAGLKVGDLDARNIREHCFTISDKALAIGGGVLEAILQRGILPLRNADRVRGGDHAPM